MNAQEQWIITYDNRCCEPEVVYANFHQDHPQIVFLQNHIKFYVEFQNRSDYAGSSYGGTADVIIVNWARSKRFAGTAKKVKLNS